MMKMEVIEVEKDSLVIPGRLMKHLEDNGGQLVLAFGHGGKWLAGYTFGQEAEDSDMAGGASYGMKDTPQACIAHVMDEVGIRD